MTWWNCSSWNLQLDALLFSALCFSHATLAFVSPFFALGIEISSGLGHWPMPDSRFLHLFLCFAAAYRL
jgi:hypothetical protein